MLGKRRIKETFMLGKRPIKETYARTHKIFIHETYGVAMLSRLLEITGLFCKTAPYKRQYSAKETCNFKEPTNGSHPIHETCQRNLREVGGWGRVPFSRNLMSPTPRRKWYLTTGRRAH